MIKTKVYLSLTLSRMQNIASQLRHSCETRNMSDLQRRMHLSGDRKKSTFCELVDLVS